VLLDDLSDWDCMLMQSPRAHSHFLANPCCQSHPFTTPAMPDHILINVPAAPCRHMREDIAAIEACNNTLELQARNNAKLLATLQGLVNDLALDQDTTWVLEAASLTPDK
jgi:hypothetical protein